MKDVSIQLDEKFARLMRRLKDFSEKQKLNYKSLYSQKFRSQFINLQTQPSGGYNMEENKRTDPLSLLKLKRVIKSSNNRRSTPDKSLRGLRGDERESL